MDQMVARHPFFYRQMLKKHLPVTPLYCIILPQNQENSMEIYSTREIWFRWERKNSKHPMVVIGIAHNRESAQQLMISICENIYQVYGTVTAKDIREYFSMEE